MDIKTIVIEVAVAVVFTFVVGLIFLIVGANVGGNYSFPTFLGLPGYESSGAFAAMRGMPLGGGLGAYIVRRLRTSSSQKMISAAGIGLLVGIVLFLFLFCSKYL